MLSFILSALIWMAPAKEFKANDYCPLITEMNDKSINDVIECLKTKNKIMVISGGGMTEPSERLMKYVEKHKTTVLCVRCGSMAAYLWLQADKKEIASDVEIMIHYLFMVTPPYPVPLTVKFMKFSVERLQKKTHTYFNKLPKEHQDMLIKSMDNDTENGEFYFGRDLIEKMGIKVTVIQKPTVEVLEVPETQEQ